MTSEMEREMFAMVLRSRYQGEVGVARGKKRMPRSASLSTILRTSQTT